MKYCLTHGFVLQYFALPVTKKQLYMGRRKSKRKVRLVDILAVLVDKGQGAWSQLH